MLLVAAALVASRARYPATGPGDPAAAVPPGARPELGLFTSLPLLWSEADDLTAQLAAERTPSPIRAALEARYRLRPLDTLRDARLDRLRLLMMAQPRPLDPAENVALDRWVRRGGRLLLFADPMLTAPSRFALGDPRRPQDVVLLSPILAHWGLVLRFDETQPAGLREIAGSGFASNLAGRFALAPIVAGASAGGGELPQCRIVRAGLGAACRIGRGRVLAIADAALLEAGDSPPGSAAALQAMAAQAFGTTPR